MPTYRLVSLTGHSAVFGGAVSAPPSTLAGSAGSRPAVGPVMASWRCWPRLQHHRAAASRRQKLHEARSALRRPRPRAAPLPRSVPRPPAVGRQREPPLQRAAAPPRLFSPVASPVISSSPDRHRRRRSSAGRDAGRGRR